MSDALRRAGRTFLQSFLAALIASGVLSVVSESGVVDWSLLKKVGISALTAGVAGVVSWLQNALEDQGSVPPVLGTKTDSSAA